MYTFHFIIIKKKKNKIILFINSNISNIHNIQNLQSIFFSYFLKNNLLFINLFF